MFYWLNFFKIIFKYPFRGTLFLLTSGFLLLLLYQGPHLKSKFWEYYGEDLFYPHFYVLFNGEQDINYIYDKLINLPGVFKIKIQDKNILQQKIRKNLQEIGNISTDSSSSVNSKMNLEYNSFKIILDPSIGTSSIELIRKYTEKLLYNSANSRLPKSEVILTATKLNYSTVNKSAVEKKNLLSLIKNWGDKIIFIVAIILWPLSFYILLYPLKKITALIELYQRKRYVGFKTLLSGLLTINLLIGGVSCIWMPPYWCGSIISIILFLLFSLLGLQAKGQIYLEKI